MVKTSNIRHNSRLTPPPRQVLQCRDIERLLSLIVQFLGEGSVAIRNAAKVSPLEQNRRPCWHSYLFLSPKETVHIINYIFAFAIALFPLDPLILTHQRAVHALSKVSSPQQVESVVQRHLNDVGGGRDKV